MKIYSPKGKTYLVGQMIGETKNYILYECFVESGQKCFLKIAPGTEKNHILYKEGMILTTLYQAAKIGNNEPFNYHLGFPAIIDSFIATNQENRRINIVSCFEAADEPGDLVSAQWLITEKKYIDQGKSIWVLDQLFKNLAFAHSQEIDIGLIDETNVWINEKRKLIIVPNWTEANWHDDIPAETKSLEIARATKVIISLLGGNPDNGEILTTERPISGYAQLLRELSDPREADAQTARRRLQQLKV